mmetsp:Transcript_20219/g.37711  ORF Transcript_20219/g.37711 Transcript_20219/m.37711 type:complete len:183 (-) Transcript_20219:79-627(-)
MSVQVQALSINLVIIIYLAYHYLCQPFMKDTLNKLEFLACFSAGVTIYCGLYYLTMALSQEVKVLLFCVMLASNAYFLFLMLKHLIQSVATQMPDLVRFLHLKLSVNYFPEAEMSKKPLKQQVYQPFNSVSLLYSLSSTEIRPFHPLAESSLDGTHDLKSTANEVTLPSFESFREESFSDSS